MGLVNKINLERKVHIYEYALIGNYGLDLSLTYSFIASPESHSLAFTPLSNQGCL